MNTKLKDKLYNITFTINDLNHKPIPRLYYEIKNGSDLVKKNKTNDKGEIHLKYVGGNTLTIFVKKDKDNKLKKISEIHTPSKNIKVKLISPQMKFDVTLLPHEENGAYWKGTYKVQSGDTLSKIAKDHHTTVSALLALNPNIKLPNKISINEYIEIGEANADALVKLDKNTTVKVPPVKETGNVAVDRKSKSSSVIDLTTETKKTDIANNQQQISEPKNSNTTLPSSSQTKNSPEGELQKEIVQPEESTVVTQKIEVQQEHNEDKKPVAVVSLNECVCKEYDLIWGAKVNCAFRKKVVEISKELWGDSKKIEKSNMLMAVFAWESGGTFATDVPNMNNSGGTGLIQIMPDTYKDLTKKEPKIIKTKKYFNKELNVIEELKNMTPLEYLDIVKQYFLPLKNKDVAFIDFYLQVLFPASANREEHTVFAKNKNLLNVNDHVNKRIDKFERNNMDGWYIGEKGKLHKDGEKDGKVMKSEIAAAVEHYQTDGLSYKSEYKDGCSIKPTSKFINKKVIVLDPGHGILGDKNHKANGGTQIRLLKLKNNFDDLNLKIGKNYSWRDLSDEIIEKANTYFQYIDIKDPKSPAEFEYVYDRAIELKQLLESDGHTVYITRDKKEIISYKDIPNISACKALKVKSVSPLSYRKDIANAANADYFLSLHCDGVENLTGDFAVMCYFDNNGKKLAEKIAKNYSQVNGKVAMRTDLTVLGNGGVNNAKYKILIEFGFMTTPKIARNLVKNSKIIVNEIYTSLKEHIDEV